MQAGEFQLISSFMCGKDVRTRGGKTLAVELHHSLDGRKGGGIFRPIHAIVFLVVGEE